MQLSPNELDRSITDWVVDNRVEPWVSIAHAITVTGDTVVLTLVAVAIVVALTVRDHRSEATLVAVGSLLAYAVMVALKNVIGRDRPPVDDRLIDIDSYSFPSGHAMMTTVVLGLIGVALYRASDWVRQHPVVLVFVPLWAVVVGCTRVYLGVHWATDVLAGWVIGAVWVVGCAVVSARWIARSRTESGTDGASALG